MIIKQTDTQRLDVPGSYAELLVFYPLHRLADEVDLDNALEMMERLMLLRRPTRDQKLFRVTLATLIESYEREHHRIDLSRTDGLDVLKHLVQEHAMSAGALAEALGVSASTVYKILSGERSLTASHIALLQKHFGVEGSVFLPRP